MKKTKTKNIELPPTDIKPKINLNPYFSNVKLTPRILVILAFIAIIVAAAATSGYFYRQYQRLKTNPQEIGQLQTKELINKVGALVALPEGEQPTIATVTDIEKLKSQPFFAQAKNGDKVLIYTQAKKAYLYDPTANKILNVAPLNIGSPAPQASPLPTPTPSPTPSPSPEPSPSPQE